ncbi:MAG: hypothetical protein DRJ96_03805 [Thermoprotei archaeon]|nr:MAG: hypothetical protein DRJ96_03805 [Thermoprotei archaeon]
MATPSPILNMLNEWLRGCGAESQKLELFGILRDMAKAMASGELSEEQAMELIDKLASAISALRQRAGLSTDMKKLKDAMLNAVRAESGIESMDYVRRRLREIRRKRVEMTSRGGLF